MTTYYVESTRTGGADTGGSWTDAYLTLAQGFTNAALAGDIILVGKAHREILTVSKTYAINANHTANNPLVVVVVDSADDVPVDNALTDNEGELDGGTSYYVKFTTGSCYFWGLRVINGATTTNFASSNTDVHVFDHCYIDMDDINADCGMNGQNNVVFIDTLMTWGNGCDFNIQNNDGNTLHMFGCDLQKSSAGRMFLTGGGFEGVVAKLIGNNMTGGAAAFNEILSGAGGEAWSFDLQNNVMAAATTMYNSSANRQTYPLADFSHAGGSQGTESGLQNYQVDSYHGLVDADTGVYRDAANTYDGTNRFSLEVIADNVGANNAGAYGLKFLLAVLDPGNLNNTTVRVRGVTSKATIPTNADIWIECYVKDSTSGGMQNVSTKAKPTITGTNLVETGEAAADWSGEPASSKAFRIDASYSSKATQGQLYVYVVCAISMDGTTGNELFIDPTVEIV